MKKILFVVSILFLMHTIASAQNNKNRKDSTVVVIFNENKTASEKKKSRKSGEDNVIKIAPLGFISGSFPVYFERRINDFFTVQVGVGLTSKNYLRSAIQKEGNINNINYPWGDNSSKTDASERLFSFDYRKPAIGYMFSIQPRLYFESEAPDGSFLSASYDYYSYKYSIPRLEVNANGDPKNSGATKKSEYENISDLMVHWGYQSVYDKLTLEYTTGIGLRTAKGSKYIGNFDYSTNKITDEGIATYSQTGFNFSIGLKVGYHF